MNKPNILFIMADQLRADYLSCNGHPTLQTPHIDGLAAEGVNFTRAYCQAPVCGPSRMSFYTGRYAFTHGATYNNFPLSIGEKTLGDYLRPLGYRVAIVGKTHMKADMAGMRRLGVDPSSSLGVLASQCGFEPYERDDGLHPDKLADPDLPYNQYLRAKGYPGHNPWHDFANSALGPDGTTLSGWYLRNAGLPARVAEANSETAYITDRAMDFIEESKNRPWCLHLSYIKPHWPYIAPSPYHSMYRKEEIPRANRASSERDNPHPVYAAFMNHRESLSFARGEVRDRVIPTYMGLVKQLDDNIGRLLHFLEADDLRKDTIIVFTSDHGDYLGDHWLGEKELFHEESARIPLIISHPRQQAAAGGKLEHSLVESIDLLPSFVAWAGGQPAYERLEGRSLLPLLSGQEKPDWRDAAFSEFDYSCRPARHALGVVPSSARGFMVRAGQWKYVFYEGFRPQLFDLSNDPREQRDLGQDDTYKGIRADLQDRLFQWFRERKLRATVSDQEIEMRTGKAREKGIVIGEW